MHRLIESIKSLDDPSVVPQRPSSPFLRCDLSHHAPEKGDAANGAIAMTRVDLRTEPPDAKALLLKPLHRFVRRHSAIVGDVAIHLDRRLARNLDDIADRTVTSGPFLYVSLPAARALRVLRRLIISTNTLNPIAA